MFFKVWILTVVFHAPGTGYSDGYGVGAAPTYTYPNQKSCLAMASYWAKQYKVQSTHCTLAYQIINK